MYETMVYWETFDDSGDAPDFIRDFTSIWRAANKIVYSRTLDVVTSARTRLERSFDVESVRAMKASSDHDLAIGGANLASQAIEAGLVDEMHLFVTPVTIGGGTPAHPERFHSEPNLVSVERFAGGVVHLHYAFNT
jgi:dihydrofolate reductase